MSDRGLLSWPRRSARSDQFTGPGAPDLTTGLFTSINERILLGRYDPTVEIDLLAASGEIADLAGWLAFDAEDQRLAKHLNQEALTLARLSGDRDLELLVLQNMSMQALHLGHPREALLLARRALAQP